MNGYQTIDLSKYFDIAHDYRTTETISIPWNAFVDAMERIKKAEDAGVPVVIGGIVMPTVAKAVTDNATTYTLAGPTDNKVVNGYAYVDTNKSEIVIDFGVNYTADPGIIHTYAVIDVDDDDETATCGFEFVDQTPVTIS